MLGLWSFDWLYKVFYMEESRIWSSNRLYNLIIINSLWGSWGFRQQLVIVIDFFYCRKRKGFSFVFKQPSCSR